ncbi:MAG: type VII secretion protein EccCa [Mycolicibacterium sp.]|uniref:type VII secretion protein EccCa n=1 Tax=Mycolicibacterium sp. TaxID=2320850 RepID=UPI003D0B1F43
MTTSKIHVRPDKPAKAPTSRADEVALEKPPMTPLAPPASARQRIGPLFLVLGLAGVMYVGFKSGRMFSGMGMLLPLMMIGGAATMFGRSGSGSRVNMKKERADYARYIDVMRNEANRAAADQFAVAQFHYPEPAALAARVGSDRMWERRQGADMFGRVRLGLGVERADRRYAEFEVGALEDQEPACIQMADDFLAEHTFVRDIAKSLTLVDKPAWMLTGDQDRARAALRAMLAHIALFHGPDDVSIVVIADEDRAPQWDWLKWLPHHRGERGHGRSMLAFRSAGDFAAEFGEGLRERGYHTGRGVRVSGLQNASGDAGQPEGAERHLVVLCDAESVDWASLLVDGKAFSGVSILDMSGTCPVTDRATTLVFTPDGQMLKSEHAESSPEFLVIADAMTVDEAEVFARKMAPWQPGSQASQILAAAGDTVASIDLAELLGIADFASFDPAETWRWSENHRNFLRVPVGRYIDTGRTWYLDLKEDDISHGPHLGLAGSTGGGKSELLRTLCLALCLTHSPDDLIITACDFKGNKTFAGLERLPHVTAVLHNLDNDRDRIARILQVFQGELIIRQKLLDSVGELAKDIDEYRRLRVRRPEMNLPPMPHWFVPFDELMQAKREFPELLSIMAIIGTVGRSLGVHELPVSQTFDAGLTKNINTHVKGRIGLKMNDANDYKAILGKSNPGALPNRKGVGYFVENNDAPAQRIEACYVSGPYVPPKAPVTVEEVRAQRDYFRPRLLSAVGDTAAAAIEDTYSAEELLDEGDDIVSNAAALLAELEAEAQQATGDDDADIQTNMKVAIDRLASMTNLKPRSLWLPELTSYTPVSTYAEAFETQRVRDRRDPLELVAACGVVDIPREQVQETLLVDLSANLTIAGDEDSGKTSALLSIMMAAGWAYDAERVQFYCIDMGGGDLRAAEALDHVGAVVPGVNNTYGVDRVLNHVRSIIRARTSRWAVEGIYGAAAWRKGRFGPTLGVPGSPEAPVDVDGYGDVYLVIDGADTFAKEYPDRLDTLLSISQTGPGAGVHLVMTIRSWNAPAVYKFLDSTPARYELRLGEVNNTQMTPEHAKAVPNFPGRGLIAATGRGQVRRDSVGVSTDSIPPPKAHHILFASPEVAIHGQALDWAGSAQVVNARHAGHGKARSLPVLPESIAFAELPATTSEGLLLGLRESDESTQVWSPERDSHLCILGEANCGKATALTVLGRQLQRRIETSPTATKPVVVVFDLAQDLTGVIPGADRYVYQSQQVGEAVSFLRGLLADRQTEEVLSQEELLARRGAGGKFTGPPIFVVISGLTQLVDTYSDPFADVAPGLNAPPPVSLIKAATRGAEIGFHLLVSRVADAGVLQGRGILPAIRQAGAPVLLMSADESLLNVVGKTRGQKLRPGRGLWLAGDDRMMIQVATDPGKPR